MTLETGSLTDTIQDMTQQATGAEPTASSTQTEPTEATPSTGQTAGQQTAAQPVYDWTKDDRYDRMWKKDPNSLYKSYKSADELIEKQYKPMRAQMESFNSLVKEYGYESVDQIKSAFDELKTWKDPENQIVKRGNYFSFFYDHPEYGPQLQNVVENFRKQEIRKQFGEGVSDEIVSEIIANRKFREDAETKERHRIEQENHQKLVGTIEEGWKRVESECKSMGFPLTEDIRVQLLTECEKQNVDPRFMFYKFQDMFKEEVSKHQRAMIQSEQKKLQEKSRRSGVIPAQSVPNRPKPAGTEKQGIFERVKSNLGL